MNVVKILLVLGLGYVALNQKVEKTRNMLLVVTGLLAFCMFSMEGFEIDATSLEATFDGDTISTGPLPKTITVSGTDAPIYTVTGDITATADSITGITCKMAASDSANGTIGLTDAAAATDYNPATDPASISTTFTCAAATTTGQSCSAGETAGKNCPPYYKVKTGNCAAEPCLDTEFAATGVCCEKVCPAADCEEYPFWGLGEDGAECGAPSGWFGYTVKQCNTDS
jgi:hypothetical protein